MAVVPGEAVAIAAIRDRVIRNLRITECYHRLSLEMAARTGAGANWSTFVTWGPPARPDEPSEARIFWNGFPAARRPAPSHCTP
jgi:hypothetical protein